MTSFTERLLRNIRVSGEIVQLEFSWAGPPPRGGQFFMVKPKRSGVFLGRPLSAALWSPGGRDTPENRRRFRGKTYADVEFFKTDTVRFFIALRGRGTKELADMAFEDKAELTGPLGNAWGDFLPPAGKVIALIGGGIGIAPLLAFASELAETSRPFDLYAGFQTASLDERRFRRKPGVISPAKGLIREADMDARETLIATEDGLEGRKGRIPDFFDPAGYGAVYACGPEPMLKAVAEKCRRAAVPCFISLERRMACGAGACLGCTVRTAKGNRRCCADGPVFSAEEIYFEN
ncbi:MAG: dihydroorotate dehydrogenase electron transfer subunit [Treponema sp.]|jgi:NAD(P)H-flavin reductase|nr:dihydroorotate dehydrogenase electron transfer subunit [Treponema sp.]